MKRPQSAKPGYKGYWGQASSDDINDQSLSGKTGHRKQVKIMKPDLTTHDFARILPKKIHQDKQRLYSEALQLKQSLNETTQENIRLKNKISILQKEKDKMNRYLQTAPECLSKQGNSRLNIYGQKSNEKQNMIVRNMKKIVRESKEEIQYLKLQNQKIKKTIKYTKINQLQIQKKTVLDQNKKLSALLEQYNNQIISQDQMQRENEELKKYLEEELQQNKQLTEDNEKYQEILESLQQKIKTQNQKYQNREKKISRDLALQKRKTQEQQKHIEDLRRELKNFQSNQEQAINMKKKQVKPVIRPASSNINNYRSAHLNIHPKENPINIPPQDVQTQEIKLKNQLLEKQLKEIRLKLELSQIQLKKKGRQNSFKENIDKKSQKSQHTPKKTVTQQKIIIRKKETEPEAQIQKPKPQSSRLQKKYDFQDSPQKQDQSYGNAFEPAEESYQQEFQKSEEVVVQPKQDKKVAEIEQMMKLKKDFEENEEQEQLYKKDESQRKNKKGEDKKKKKQKKQPKSEYKVDKKIMAQIKQLLTYRMKSQRYPFDDLKADIEAAESPTFTYSDLCNMLVNEPFYLTSQYTKAFLCYCYKKQKIDQNDTIQKTVLVSKLRNVINDFQLLQESQQKQMILRIAEMTSTYPYELQTAFQNIKNGEETVTKKDLIQMFQKLQLEDKYIQLIIAELSLCSDDIQHLNFHGFFQRFYIQQQEYQQNNAIEQQGEESQQSHKNTSRIKKSKNTRKPSASEQLQEKMGHYMLAPQQPIENKNYAYDEDIVSDDGRL